MSAMATAALRAPNQSQVAIERFFQTSLYLLVLSGFMLLASTGRLDVLSMSVVAVALLIRGILLLRSREFTIPEQWTNYFTIGYVAFYAFDYFVLSRSFINATVHLTLFSMAVKLFGVYRERDNIYLALLSFGMVLSAAVLTVDSMFFFALAIFLLLATATFITMEMRRSAKQSTVWACEHGGDDRKLRAALSLMTLVLLLGVLAAAIALFFVLPRRSGGYLSAFASRNQFVSGFSDTVELGQIGQIQQSSIVVMHLNIAGDTTGHHQLLWRGVALNLFDGSVWKSQERFTIVSPRFRNYDLQREYAQTEGLDGTLRGPAALLRYIVSMEPVGTNVFFFSGEPRELRGDYGPLSMDSNGSLFNNGSRGNITNYEATSILPLAGSKELSAAGREFPAFVTLNYLQLPKLDPRVRDLARQVTSGTSTDYEKVVAVERYLQSKYAYTLDLGHRRPEDPIAYFLFDRKKGHCEYFASSMAIMLRTLGIPSRIVNGFRGGEFNDLTGNYIIRARDAHSWVEAYFPRYGWVQFDPTPAAGAAVITRWTRIMLYLDAAREFWREWVINYDFIHQMDVSRKADELGRGVLLKADLRWKSFYNSLVSRARHARDGISPVRATAWGVVLIAALALLVNLRRIRQILRQRRIAKDPASAPKLAATIWYERMTATVSKQGWEKKAGQTPAEFMHIIEDPELRRSVERFTERYHRARFNESAEDAMELPELYEEISASRPK
jgi:protein-glutamine gamma-glutamyltransferase